jgi:KaiC/GvpD/RAD55 family RecA-like ATPase
MKGHEKRGAPRVPYIAEVVCEGASNRLTARTSDISASGVFIHSTLCCEAGSILKLKFSVTSTQIETVGEVCYSIPHIGMGVRFLDLKPEYHTAIEGLIESQSALADGEDVKNPDRSVISCGVDPVDKLLGGLERGYLYLAHGDAAGKSLFGIQFLIEGLKRGQPGALITPHRREDAARRFARLGYDCLQDIRSGKLVLYRCSHEMIEQIQQLPHLEPLLSELAPLLDESAPQRIVFDPVDSLLDGDKHDDATARANELAVWLRSFGATVVLVANEAIESLAPAVRESFRFEVRESLDRMVRFIVFERSSWIPDQPVRVDPSRGISLLEDRLTSDRIDEQIDVVPETRTDFEAPNSRTGAEGSTGDLRMPDTEPEDRAWLERMRSQLRDSGSLVLPFKAGNRTPAGSDAETGATSSPTDSDDLTNADAEPEARDAFFAMLDELQSFVSGLDPEVAEKDIGVIPERSLNAPFPEPEAGHTTPRVID